MSIELAAQTVAGDRLVAVADALSESLAARAAEHDRDGTFPFEAIDALRAASYFAAPVPVELGGLGVASAHDLVVASSRLARGGYHLHLELLAAARFAHHPDVEGPPVLGGDRDPMRHGRQPTERPSDAPERPYAVTAAANSAKFSAYPCRGSDEIVTGIPSRVDLAMSCSRLCHSACRRGSGAK